ncbi:hypothetical protein [Propionivibrio sp.]|uniref:hypothetical protein n=1 Tax=Propionivibrio sp. TaxID=2212460 RepID=UPI003BF419C9
MAKVSPFLVIFLDFDGHRHAQIGHSVEHRRIDPCLGLLLRQRSRFHEITENEPVPLYSQLYMTAQVAARFALPGDTSILCNEWFEYTIVIDGRAQNDYAI